MVGGEDCMVGGGEGGVVGEFWELYLLREGWKVRTRDLAAKGEEVMVGGDNCMVGGEEFGLEDSALQGEYKEEKGSNCPGKGK